MSEPNLRTVLDLSERALMFIAHRHAMTPEAQAAISAIHELTDLARRGLGAPTQDDMRWALHCDPYTSAAYSMGRALGRADT